MDLSGVDMAREAAQRCYKDSNLTSSDVDVLEVGIILTLYLHVSSAVDCCKQFGHRSGLT